MLNIMINDKVFRLIGVCAPSDPTDRPGLFRRFESFLKTSGRIVIAGDGNALLDSVSYIDRIGPRSSTNNQHVKPFRDSNNGCDIIDKYRDENTQDAL